MPLRAHHFGTVVSDMDRAIEFYEDTLGLDLESRFTLGEMHAVLDGVDDLPGTDPAETEVEVAFLELGEFYLELNEYRYPPNEDGNAWMDNHDIGRHHVSFRVSDVPGLYERFADDLAFLSEPHHSEKVGVATVKFTDPDDNLVEFFDGNPDDGRDAAMHGFDHYALQVSDLERSVEFYRDTLGMEELFRFSPTGDVQPRLNDLPAETVDSDVVFLDAGGARIEMGRYKRPESTNANERLRPHDVGRGHVSLLVEDTEDTYESLQGEMEFLSDPQQESHGPTLVKGLDPDGNLIEFLSGLERLS